MTFALPPGISSEPVNALPLRGPWQASDQIPVLPLGAEELEAGYAGDLATFAAGAPFLAFIDNAGTNEGYVIAGGRYLVPTATAAQTALLPPLSSVVYGAWIELIDRDDNAGNHNITAQGAGSDSVIDHAVAANTFVQAVSNTTARFISLGTAWRVYVYGS